MGPWSPDKDWRFHAPLRIDLSPQSNLVPVLIGNLPKTLNTLVFPEGHNQPFMRISRLRRWAKARLSECFRGTLIIMDALQALPPRLPSRFPSRLFGRERHPRLQPSARLWILVR
ncbi:MAG: hypothetical protein CL917_04660 [Deltaproteobacteria bacterium]|nr:hypothetical protein [Deltaproteobacteria bacterium]